MRRNMMTACRRTLQLTAGVTVLLLLLPESRGQAQSLPFNYARQTPYGSADTSGRMPPPHPEHLPYAGAQGYGQPHPGGFVFEPGPTGRYYGNVTEVLPDDRGGNIASPLDAMVSETFRRMKVRLEYLHFDITDPKNALLGAPVAGVDDPSNELLARNTNSIAPRFDPIEAAIPSDRPFTGVIVPSLNEVSMADLNGIRGSLVIPTHYFDVEANVWGLEQFGQAVDFRDTLTYGQRITQTLNDFIADESGPAFDYSLDPTDVDRQDRILVGTSLRNNGSQSGLALLYNTDFTADYKSNVFGTEANLVLHPPDRGPGLQLRPLMGFRYMLVQERLNMNGFDDFSFETDDFPVIVPGDVPPQFQTYTYEIDGLPRDVLNRRVLLESRSSNNFYGPQFGLRGELVHQWFTLGVEPKVMLGLNGHTDVVRSTDILGLDNDSSGRIPDEFITRQFETSEDHTDFAAIFNLNVSARAHVSEHLSLFVSYEFLWTGRISRPYNNIYYNDVNAGQDLSGIVVDQKLTDMTIQGLTVGGEFSWD